MYYLKNGNAISSTALGLLIVAHGGNVSRYGKRLFRYDQPVPAKVAREIRRYLTPECKLSKAGLAVLFCEMDHFVPIRKNSKAMEAAA